MTAEQFRRLVSAAIDTIPLEFRQHLDNIAIVVEDEPSDDLLEDMDIEPPGTLFGLYRGTPLPERQWAHGNTLPDCITLFQGPIEDCCETDEDVVTEIGETLIHEVGHYFGMSEEELEEIEERVLAPAGRRTRGAEVKALKRFGQHFLEPSWVRRLTDVIAPGPDEAFLEIGPGRGALTRALAPRARSVLAIEIDRELAPALATASPRNVTVVEADFLEADVPSLVAPWAPMRVAGNLPFNISTPILFRLLALAEEGRRFTDATLMLQREVAERLAASPGSRAWGVLSACQQLWADVDVVLALPPGAFRPPPKVHSAVVRLRYRPARPPVADPALFVALVKAIFMQRRKMLGNALAAFATSRGRHADAALAAAGIDGRRRPETLSVEELVRLTDVFISA